MLSLVVQHADSSSKDLFQQRVSSFVQTAATSHFQ